MRYLEAFHDEEQEKKREKGKAFILEPNEHVRGFALMNAELARFANQQQSLEIATFDQDATLAATNKARALDGTPEFKKVVAEVEDVLYLNGRGRTPRKNEGKQTGYVHLKTAGLCVSIVHRWK